jgi:phosphoserine phosphatase
VKEAKELIDKLGFSMNEVCAYADHIDDIPLLEAVRYPICVTQKDSKLSAIARARGWQCLYVS